MYSRETKTNKHTKRKQIESFMCMLEGKSYSNFLLIMSMLSNEEKNKQSTLNVLILDIRVSSSLIVLLQAANDLRGYCTSFQKLACFVLYLNVFNTFMKNNTCIL